MTTTDDGTITTATPVLNQGKLVIDVQGSPATFPSNIVSTALTSLKIVKSVDKAIAVIGDTLTYSFVLTNTSIHTVTAITFTDTLPIGLTFIPTSFKYNGVVVTPTFVGTTITYVIPSMASAAVSTIEFKCTVT